MRKTGILLPVFSLPGRYGVGDFGACSRTFIRMLAEADVKVWQVLPLNPVGYGNSPYQPYSSQAGNTIYIDLETLYQEGLIAALPDAYLQDSEAVDYDAVHAFKEPYLKEAFSNFVPDEGYRAFAEQDWVYAYAVYTVLKQQNHGDSWYEWPETDKQWIKNKTAELTQFRAQIEYEMFLQYEFYRQWMAVKAYAHEQGIRIMGDIPFYCGADSLDVWMDQDTFLLNPDGYPTSVAGVPPDYFSATGQRWGNPIYDWDYLKEHDFDFWMYRLKYTAKLFDIIRIDHFRAFDTYWKIPASCPTAMEGEWIEAPGYEFFDRLLPEIPDTEIVAEDLGFMRDEVYELRDHYEFPGMDVVPFTIFDEKFVPKENMIIYTGTHDNDTIRSWYRSLNDYDKGRAQEILKEADIELTEGKEAEAFVTYAMKSIVDTCILPVQDLLGLDTDARMNIPGVVSLKNWTWKLPGFEALQEKFCWLKELIRDCNRA